MTKNQVEEIAKILVGLTWAEWNYVKTSVDESFGVSFLPEKEKLCAAIMQGPRTRDDEPFGNLVFFYSSMIQE